MRIESFISKVLQKAAPMIPSERMEIEDNMSVWFDKAKKAVKQKEVDGEVLSLKDKAFKFLDEWYVRALIAALYIFAIRWVQEFMNPEPDDDMPHDGFDMHPDDRNRR
jgi:hypothetical protein